MPKCKALTKFSVISNVGLSDGVIRNTWHTFSCQICIQLGDKGMNENYGVSVFIYDVVRTLPAVLRTTIQITL